jgi:hypothetical protein
MGFGARRADLGGLGCILVVWQEHSAVRTNVGDVEFKVRTTNGKKLETQLPRNLGRCYVNKK